MSEQLKFDKSRDKVEMNPQVSNKRKSTAPTWVREMLAELVGTFFLVMIGDAAIANYLLNRNSKIGVDHFSVAFTFGLAGMIGIVASAPISGAHLNPAVTLAFATKGTISFRKIPHYFLGQYLGAFLAAIIVFLTYYEGINAYDGGHRIPIYLPELYNETFASLATGGIFSTYPSPWMSAVGTLVDQIVATFSLVFAVLAVTNSKAKIPDYLHPFMLGMVICAMVVAFGLNCGAALNPARDLSPRIFQIIFGYGINAFKPIHSLYWLTAGVIGPHLGAILAVWLFDYALLFDPNDEVDRNQNQLENNENTKSNQGNEDQAKKPFLIVDN